MKYKLFVLPVLLLLIFVSKAQIQEISKEYPLYIFLQNNFDSAVVSYSIVPRYYSHNYSIIAKKNDKIYLFIYGNPYESIYKVKHPDSLHLFFEKKYLEYLYSIPDTNNFFVPKFLPNKDPLINTSWRNIINTNLFSFKTDLTDSCIDKNGIVHEIFDDETIYFITITHREIKHLSFYAPEFFVKFCPTLISRKVITSIEAFRQLFD